MNTLTIYTLKALRKLYAKAFRVTPLQKPECVNNPVEASKIIYDALKDDKPCLIARFGAFELTTLENYFGVKTGKQNIISYIKGEQKDWWWNISLINAMHNNAGFFPPVIEKIEQFCELMLEDITQVDVLGSWVANERLFDRELSKALKVHLRFLEPFWSEPSWIRALEGKKVLVVHPFVEEIASQYKKRELIFKNGFLPQFELNTVRAVQTIAGEVSPFADWFEALEYMKSEIDKVDYDVCLIGAGAYGFPLAAHVKRMGKKGFHMGGALQLLFGIRGKRWDDPQYGVVEWGLAPGEYTNLINEFWVRPGSGSKPKEAGRVEGGCYW